MLMLYSCSSSRRRQSRSKWTGVYYWGWDRWWCSERALMGLSLRQSQRVHHSRTCCVNHWCVAASGECDPRLTL